MKVNFSIKRLIIIRFLKTQLHYRYDTMTVFFQYNRIERLLFLIICTPPSCSQIMHKDKPTRNDTGSNLLVSVVF